MKYLLGYDIGSSFIKCVLLEAGSGKIIASASSPETEMNIHAPRPGFAEQDPEQWWREMIIATRKLKSVASYRPDEIIAVGISYQMHGLVCIDNQQMPLRPAILWCDSRAVDIGNTAFQQLGETFCLQHYLNSPGNFTASKLKWVKDHEPEIFDRIDRVFLPGDYIAMKMTGIAATTVSGLSEGILWDYTTGTLATDLLDFYGIDKNLLAKQAPTFGEQGRLTAEAAVQLGITSGTPVSYRAGDQPNNAFSLNVLQPGEIAATAGTSGVVYGVTDKANHDPLSRVNPFVHVNHSAAGPRYGVLLCVNGTGSLNSWLHKHVLPEKSYGQMNDQAALAPIGCDELFCYPFGNGAERILLNQQPGASFHGMQFNRHQLPHLLRSAQEGIVFSLNYGMEIMQHMGMPMKTIRAGFANMFLSDIFSSTFASVSGCTVELYNTDGAAGAARGAGIGAGYYSGFDECFRGMGIVKSIEPGHVGETRDAYEKWKQGLLNYIM